MDPERGDEPHRSRSKIRRATRQFFRGLLGGRGGARRGVAARARPPGTRQHRGDQGASSTVQRGARRRDRHLARAREGRRTNREDPDRDQRRLASLTGSRCAAPATASPAGSRSRGPSTQPSASTSTSAVPQRPGWSSTLAGAKIAGERVAELDCVALAASRNRCDADGYRALQMAVRPGSESAEAPLVDVPTAAILEFSNGSRRYVHLSEDGRRPSTRRGAELFHLRLARARRVGARAAAFAFALALTAVVSNEVAKLYSDRQRAGEIKTDLVASINSSTVRVYNRALVVASAAVEQQSDRALLKRRNAVVARWFEESADIDGRVFAHFPASQATRDWRRYEQAIFVLLSLAHVNPYTNPQLQVRKLRGYLSSARDTASTRLARSWRLLECRTATCRRSEERFRAYRSVGDRLLVQRAAVMRSFLDARVRDLG